MVQSGASDGEELLAVGHPAVIFAPSHLARIGTEVTARDVVVRADLSPTQAREEGLRHVRAGLAVAVGFRVIDALRQEAGVQGVTETEVNLRNKISRGGFTAAFFVQALSAMGCQTIRLDDA